MKIICGQSRFPFFAVGVSLFFVFSSHAQLPGARITATQGRLDTVCGTHNMKVVFSCRNAAGTYYGYFVDFSEAVPQIRLMANVTNAWFPVISSDGRWITYQTRIEKEGPPDNAVKGRIWFRELAQTGTPVQVADTAYVPRFVQNTPADTPQIVYAVSVQCPAGICWNSGKTLKKSVDTVSKVPQPAQTVFDSGSYYGGLSYDNRYLVTGWPGGPNAFMLDLQNSTAGPAAVHTMHVRKDSTDADTFVAVGTCNISRSASRIFTNTMLFYDFGSGAITAAGCHHPILGTWAEHGKLFISRYDAEELRVFDMPADRAIAPPAHGAAIRKEWFYPEWSNHPYYAVASLNIDRLFDSSGEWVHRYNSESVYLLNLRDSVYVKLLETIDTAITSTVSFNYPWVWVEVPAGFTEDTAWLSTTLWERSPPAVKYTYQGKRRVDLRTMLSCGANLRNVHVYTLSGKEIGSLHPVPAAGINVKRAFSNLPMGIYLLAIETLTDEKRWVRWVKPE